MILACLLPLLLAGYVLFTASRNKNDSEMLNELLVTGIIDDELRLLSDGADNTARLEQQPVAAIDDQSPLMAGNATGTTACGIIARIVFRLASTESRRSIGSGTPRPSISRTELDDSIGAAHVTSL